MNLEFQVGGGLTGISWMRLRKFTRPKDRTAVPSKRIFLKGKKGLWAGKKEKDSTLVRKTYRAGRNWLRVVEYQKGSSTRSNRV